METKREDQRPSRRGLLIAYVLGVVSILAVLGIIEYAGFFCSGPCAVRQCNPTSPCTWNGKTYTSGTICGAGEGLVCDVGYIVDCHCNTFIETLPNGVKQPTCVCN
jgi:hypothetical protein